jgi:small multidrug resistance pump
MMMRTEYVYLLIAIIAEVMATSSLKASQSFTRLLPSLVVIVGYGAAFYFLSLSLKGIGVGVAYALWSGIGIVLLSVVGVVVFGEKIDLPAVIGFALIVAGVVILNLYSNVVAH